MKRGLPLPVIGAATRNHEKRVAISPLVDSRNETTTKQRINGRTTMKHVIRDCVNIGLNQSIANHFAVINCDFCIFQTVYLDNTTHKMMSVIGKRTFFVDPTFDVKRSNISVKLKRKTTLVENGSSVIFSNLNNFLTIDILKSSSECNDRRNCDKENFSSDLR